MKKPVKRRTTFRGSSFGKDYFTMIAQITLMAVFIFRIPLGYIIGDKGMADFGLANEIFAVVAGNRCFWVCVGGGRRGGERKEKREGEKGGGGF